ncbi:DJ-1/PfpI family protein [Xanthobacter autotrophicus]|uniref:DJ-1/PfpI family protein n=1 Tax=Xanthobacter autotrophicus TaxID=280 RepID=UPI003726D904
MTLTRRDIALAGLLGPLLAQAAPFAAKAQAPAALPEPPAAAHDMSAMPAHWMGSEKIAFLIYPQFTALDMVGPHYMLTSLMGATTHVVAKTKAPVTSDTGLVFTPSATFEDCPADLDILCVPGGSMGTLAAMRDDDTLRFLKDRGSRAKYVTSVCTGSLLLGAAGLLQGYKATSHWAARPLLTEFGAIPTAGRVVRDRNRITGGGVTAGIDFGLALVGSLRDRTYAEGVQLLAEYAPEPPFDAGTPQRAPAEVTALIEGMFTTFLAEAAETGRAAFARAGSL